jgi:hypothetical protein
MTAVSPRFSSATHFPAWFGRLAQDGRRQNKPMWNRRTEDSATDKQMDNLSARIFGIRLGSNEFPRTTSFLPR